MKHRKKRILILEDDFYLRRNLKAILEKNEYCVVDVATVAEAISAIQCTKEIDLYLLDIWVSDGEGFTVCKEIRKRNEKPIIFLTVCESEDFVVKGLNLGADDYVIKPFRTNELLSRIQANLRRMEKKQTANGMWCEDLFVDVTQGIVKKNGELLTITAMEYRLLELLMQNSEHIVKRETILAYLWEYAGYAVEDNTLSVAVSRLRSKIGNSYIETIRGFGYRFRGKVERRS